MIMHHKIKIHHKIFADKWIEAKMVDDDIEKMLDRLNALIEFNIAIARFRLAMMSLEVNKFMKMTNGNRKLKIYYQNIPGTLSKQNMLTTIESLLSRLDPDLLAIAEPKFEDIDIDWYPYILVKGHIKNGKNCRLNLLIKSDLQFVQTRWSVEIPHVAVKVEGWLLVACYREWAKCGDQDTKSIDMQLERWSKFVSRWSKEKGKRKMVFGDMNFDYWNSDGSQRQLRPIRDKIL